MRQIRPLFRETVGPIHHQIRPFTRAVRPPLRHLKQAANPLTRTSTGLTSSFKNLNLGLNALAYNPPGSAQEGYLFWLGWLNHDTNALFFTQDAAGPLRHGIVMLSCVLALGAETAAFSDKDVETLLQLSGVPLTKEIHTVQPACADSGLFPPPAF
jgi:phospholipid/cholesterol/gamma-HCH transport system substrate-binding protein